MTDAVVPVGAPTAEYQGQDLSPMTAHVIAQAQKEGDARRSIASRLVWAYVALLFVTLLVPVTLYLAAPVPSSSQLSAIKDLATPLSAGLSSVTGVVGFVLGYYFKTEERKPDPE